MYKYLSKMYTNVICNIPPLALCYTSDCTLCLAANGWQSLPSPWQHVHHSARSFLPVDHLRQNYSLFSFSNTGLTEASMSTSPPHIHACTPVLYKVSHWYENTVWWIGRTSFYWPSWNVTAIESHSVNIKSFCKTVEKQSLGPFIFNSM